VVQADVTEAAEIAQLIPHTERALGPIRVLVNNAGGIRDRLVFTMSEDDWDYMWKMNLDAPRRLSRDAVLTMKNHRRGGRIINLGSVVGVTGNAGQANYAAAKAAILGLTEESAVKAAPFGITVNCVVPGYIITDATAHLNPSQNASWISRIPQARLATPDEVAEVIAFLSGEHADYITGQCIAVDGGLVAAASGNLMWR
jgi:3-oxoacyl-[acyl-carrier protein] reductase